MNFSLILHKSQPTTTRQTQQTQPTNQIKYSENVHVLLPDSNQRRSVTQIASQMLAHLNLNTPTNGSSIHEIKKKFHPYKIHFVQEVKEDDFDSRIQFCESTSSRWCATPLSCKGFPFLWAISKLYASQSTLLDNLRQGIINECRQITSEVFQNAREKFKQRGK